jgi:site-specific recombinase XerD
MARNKTGLRVFPRGTSDWLAFKSFFHFVSAETPDYLFQCQQIISIPMKKTSGKVMNYLSPEGIHHLLMQPDTRTWKGRRDHALLVLLYDAALRVQELVDLQIHALRLESPTVVQVVGKGRKGKDHTFEREDRRHCW